MYSWAEIAAGAHKQQSTDNNHDPSKIYEYDPNSPLPVSDSSLFVTASELERGVKYSWSENPATLPSDPSSPEKQSPDPTSLPGTPSPISGSKAKDNNMNPINEAEKGDNERGGSSTVNDTDAAIERMREMNITDTDEGDGEAVNETATTATTEMVGAGYDGQYDTNPADKGKGKEIGPVADATTDKTEAEEDDQLQTSPVDKGKGKETYAPEDAEAAGNESPHEKAVIEASVTDEKCKVIDKSVENDNATDAPAAASSNSSGEASAAAASSSNSGMPYRVEGATVAIHPDPQDGSAHASGLTYEERRAAVERNVAAAMEQRRLKDAEETGDVAMGFRTAYNGKTDLYLHREVIQQHSEWLRERMPPPNADGSIVTMWMGDSIMEFVYHTMKFMYFGKLDNCELTTPFNMIPFHSAVNHYVMGCAYKCRSIREYTLAKLQQIYEMAKGALGRNGNYFYFELNAHQWASCEAALRFANFCAFKELLYPELMAPVLRLVVRTDLVVLAWLNRQPCMRGSIRMFWIRQESVQFPWREAVWFLRRKGEIGVNDCEDWSVVGAEIGRVAVRRALRPYGSSF